MRGLFQEGGADPAQQLSGIHNLSGLPTFGKVLLVAGYQEVRTRGFGIFQKPVIRFIGRWRTPERWYRAPRESYGAALTGRGFVVFPHRGYQAVDLTRSQLVGPGAFGRGLHGAQFLWGWGKGLDVVLDAHDHHTGFAPAADYKTFVLLGGPPDDLADLGAGG